MESSTLAAILVLSLIFGVPLTIYVSFLLLCLIPCVQRNIIYAHKIHTLWWKDINKPEQWGFAKNQATPFSITTSDGETLYAWHILPLPLYVKHEASLSAQPTGFCEDIIKTENFRLLRDDPNAKLVISFHGNAAQITQGHRPSHYHALTDSTPYHLLTIDYRGFGLSTGTPTERGLILDAVASVRWAVEIAGVHPSRIVLMGQSLGTAVTCGVIEALLCGQEGDDEGFHVKEDFAGIVLVAGFSSLPRMLGGYAIAGWVPVLRPLKVWPRLYESIVGRLVDKWDSAVRLRRVVSEVRKRKGRLRLSLVHAKDDWDIPCKEDDTLFEQAIKGLVEEAEAGERVLSSEELGREKTKRMVIKGKDAFLVTWREGDVVVRQELFPYGGHNNILCYAPVLLAVMRAFGAEDESECSE